MKVKEVIGIDISKSVIDVCIHTIQNNRQFENTPKGFRKMIVWTFKNITFSKEEVLFIFEHTGLYSYQLSQFLNNESLLFCMISGLEIKRSLGIARGKNDMIDASRIALYGFRLREELIPTKTPKINISKLKSLLSLRDRLVKQRAGFKATLREQKRVYKVKEYETILAVQEKMIEALSEQIKTIMRNIKKIISNDQVIKEQYELITSIQGLGAISAISMIVYTDCFVKFKTWRQFASYCGIAPFPHQSGSSINRRNRVSNLANKKLKSILNMCAICALQTDPEIKDFFNSRIEKGKHKMSTINIIRNKLVARAFAVVRRKTPYVIKYEIETLK